MRHNTEHGLPRLFLKEVECRRQQGHVAAKFVDDESLDEGTLLLVEEFQRAHEGGERAAAVDVCDEEDGRA